METVSTCTLQRWLTNTQASGLRSEVADSHSGILLSLSDRWDIVILASYCLYKNDGTLSFWHLTDSLRTMGLKQNVFCFCFCWEFHVRITFSYFNLHGLTNSITEISEGGRQLMYDSMYKCGETVAHATFSPNVVWTSRFLLRNKKHRLLQNSDNYSLRI